MKTKMSRMVMAMLFSLFLIFVSGGFISRAYAAQNSGNVEVDKISVVMAKQGMLVEVHGYNHHKLSIHNVTAKLKVSEDDGFATWKAKLNNVTLAPNSPFTLTYQWPSWGNPAPVTHIAEVQLIGPSLDFSQSRKFSVSFMQSWEFDMFKQKPTIYLYGFYMAVTLIAGGAAVLIIKKKKM